MVRLIEVRQPQEHDLVGRTFTIAGFGTGFEATVLWRVLVQDVLGEGRLKGVGSMGVIDDFGDDVSLVPSAQARGAHVVLEVFGDDASGQNPPGPDLNRIHVTLFTELRGWRLYEVVRGDTLTNIAHEQGEGITAGDVFEANRDTVTDPNRIFPGQVLRVPLL
jgi:LysM domain/Immunoglobulin-like domain of bacterial spore germination